MPAPGETPEFARLRAQVARLESEKIARDKAEKFRVARERAFARLRAVDIDAANDTALAADIDAAIQVGAEETLVRALARHAMTPRGMADTIGEGVFGESIPSNEPWAQEFSRGGAAPSDLHSATQLRRIWSAQKRAGNNVSWQEFLSIEAPELSRFANAAK
jgi:hypothetical protein